VNWAHPRWRSVNPLGQSARDTVTKRLPVLELPIRIDLRRNILTVFPNGLEVPIAMKRPNATWRMPQKIYKNMPGGSPLRSSRIAVISITDGGSGRTPTYNHRTAVAEYYIGVHGLNWGRRRGLFGPRTL
jgi:hypothetical protein